jgi:hypothetical protein
MKEKSYVRFRPINPLATCPGSGICDYPTAHYPVKRKEILVPGFNPNLVVPAFLWPRRSCSPGLWLLAKSRSSRPVLFLPHSSMAPCCNLGQFSHRCHRSNSPHTVYHTALSAPFLAGQALDRRHGFRRRFWRLVVQCIGRSRQLDSLVLGLEESARRGRERQAPASAASHAEAYHRSSSRSRRR